MAKLLNKAQKVRTIVRAADAKGVKPAVIVARIVKQVDLNEPAARTYMYNARKVIAAEQKAQKNASRRVKKAA